MALLIVPKESWTYSTPSTSVSQPQSQSQPQTSSSAAQTSSNDFGALAELVDPSLRRKVAKDVNEAILQSQGERREANIRYLVRARAWAEQLAREKKMDLPERLSLGLDGDDAESSGGQTNNGNPSGSAGGDTDMAEDGNAAEEPGLRRSARRSGGGSGGGGSGDAVMARYTNVPP